MNRPVAPPLAPKPDQFGNVGKLRLGATTKAKNGKPRPTSLEHWRITTPDQAIATKVAATYGGEAKPWKNAKANPQDQWEVFTTTAKLDVWIPQTSVILSYESWAGGVMQRSCDGTTCALYQRPQNHEYVPPIQARCECNAKGFLDCKPRLRMDVILPRVSFGAFRLETSSREAIEQFPGTTELLRVVQANGLVAGELGIEARSKQGGQRQFRIPVLRVSETPAALAAGSGSAVPALAAGGGSSLPAAPAVEAGPPPPPDDDDVVVEAEIVDEESASPSTHGDPDSTAPLSGSPPPPPRAAQGLVCAVCGDALGTEPAKKIDGERIHARCAP